MMAVVALADYLPRMGVGDAVPGEAHPAPSSDRIAEAVAMARQEAEAVQEARLAALREEHRAEVEAQLAEARRVWLDEQSEPLTARIGSAFADLETSLADAMTRVLAPFLATVARRRAVDDLVATLGSLLRGPGQRAVRISGPDDLLALVETRLGPLAGAVEFVAADGVDVTVVADRSIIATQIGAWVDRLWNEEGDGDG